MCGVYILSIEPTRVIAQGACVTGDDTEKRIDLRRTGLHPIGIAPEAIGNGISTVRARLDGVARAAAA